VKRSPAAREAVRFLVWLAILAAGVFVARAAALAPDAVERLYGDHLFPAVVRVVGYPGREAAISLAQIIVLAAPIALFWWWIGGTVRAIRLRSYRRGLGPPSLPVALAAILVWGFQVTWGFNDARPKVDRRFGLAAVEPTPERLAKLVRLLAAEANRTYRWAIESGQIAPAAGFPHTPDATPHGTPAVDSTPKAPAASSRLEVAPGVIADRLGAAFDRLLPVSNGLSTSTPKRPRVLGWILPRLGISGFYFPYTAEVSVDGGIPASQPLFVTAHEMAHQRGMAREDEANFLAYLACRESGLPAARYAGALGAFSLAFNALRRVAPDTARALAKDLLDPGPRADRSAIRAYFDRRSSRLQPVAHRANDAFLKASGQRAGVGTYGEAVRLLLAWEAAGRLDAD
jgi:hypothetical protein